METHDTTTQATDLGFSIGLPVSEPPPPETELTSRLKEYITDLAPDERVSFMDELIRQNSLVALYEIDQHLAQRALDPTMTVANVVAIRESLLKTARLEKKQESHGPAGSGYQLVINIGGSQAETFKGVTVEQKAEALPDA